MTSVSPGSNFRVWGLSAWDQSQLSDIRLSSEYLLARSFTSLTRLTARVTLDSCRIAKRPATLAFLTPFLSRTKATNSAFSSRHFPSPSSAPLPFGIPKACFPRLSERTGLAHQQ